MPNRNIARRWLTLALPLIAISLLTACSPRVISAPPQPSVKPIIPPSLRKCPEPLSWLANLTCTAQPSGKPTGSPATTIF